MNSIRQSIAFKRQTGSIVSISDLEKVVADWEAKFYDPGKGFPAIWYRGQPQQLDPQPGILRPPFLTTCDQDEIQIEPVAKRLWAREQTINRQFRRMTASLVPSGSDLVFLYFLAQHHGLPTRLLDWTTNPLAALFFAVSPPADQDGEVIIVQPKELAPFTEMRDSIITDTAAAVFGDEQIKHDASIIPLLPDLFAGRMLQQSSCFTLHTPPIGLNGTQATPPQPATIPKLERHIIPHAAKGPLTHRLRLMGVTEATLFPDIDHAAKAIRSAWRV